LPKKGIVFPAMLGMKPKPHEEMKLGKSKAKIKRVWPIKSPGKKAEARSDSWSPLVNIHGGETRGRENTR
jgi:hypothetical protein